ncbi:MAG: 6-pyruvoyl-tetrahydropterin synthase-related protein [Anaerolineae bacterium]
MRLAWVPSTYRRLSARLPGWAWGLAGVIILSLPAVLPLCQAGYFTSHDGMLHLYRLMGLDQAMRAGVLYPRWFPDFAFGYGHPILHFYGPLAYYLAQWFRGIGLGLVEAMKAAYAAAGIGAGMSMYAFAYTSFRRKTLPAVIAGTAYVYIPYHLADLYVRGAIAESLAFVWFPLTLWGVERILDRRRGGIPLLAVSLAGLIVTHSLSLILFGPFLGLYLLAALLSHRRQAITLVRDWGIAGLLGIGLSAFYWLPVLLESRWVGLAGGASAGYQRHLAPIIGSLSPYVLYYYVPAQGTPAEHPAGLVTSAIALAGGLAGLSRIKHIPSRALILMALAALGGWFMTTTASLPLWKLGEGIVSYLQYPWRFQALHALGTAWLAGVGVLVLGQIGKTKTSRALANITAAAVILLTAVSSTVRLPYQTLEISDAELTLQRMWAEEREAGQIGTTWTGEYLPIWVREQRWAIGRSWRDAGGPNLWEAGAIVPPDAVHLLDADYNRLDLTVESSHPAGLIIHQFYFPGMVAQIDGKSTPAYPFGTLGLAAVDIPAGSHHIRWRFAPTPPRQWGMILSATSGLIGLLLWTLRSRRVLLYIPVIAILCLLPLALPAFSSPAGTAWEEVQADFDGQASLLSASRPAGGLSAGGQLPITLYWLAHTGFREDLVTFVHMTTEDGTTLLTQSDHEPDGGFTPTTRWLAGEIIPDRHVLHLPASLPPGRYVLYAGMYAYPSLQSLPIRSSERPVHAGRVWIGYVEVRAP